jgi:hypothetical protein
MKSDLLSRVEQVAPPAAVPEGFRVTSFGEVRAAAQAGDFASLSLAAWRYFGWAERPEAERHYTAEALIRFHPTDEPLRVWAPRGEPRRGTDWGAHRWLLPHRNPQGWALCSRLGWAVRESDDLLSRAEGLALLRAVRRQIREVPPVAWSHTWALPGALSLAPIAASLIEGEAVLRACPTSQPQDAVGLLIHALRAPVSVFTRPRPVDFRVDPDYQLYALERLRHTHILNISLDLPLTQFLACAVFRAEQESVVPGYRYPADDHLFARLFCQELAATQRDLFGLSSFGQAE